jgi:hypothetical protein
VPDIKAKIKYYSAIKIKNNESTSVSDTLPKKQKKVKQKKTEILTLPKKKTPQKKKVDTSQNINDPTPKNTKQKQQKKQHTQQQKKKTSSQSHTYAEKDTQQSIPLGTTKKSSRHSKQAKKNAATPTTKK